MLSATTETLRLISAHPGDLAAVLHGILAKAAELCGGEAGSVTLGEGEFIRYVASHGPAMQPYIGTLGYATCGEIGFDGRTEYTAIGPVVNLAARVCAIAPGGQILVTQRVQTAVDDRVTSTSLGDHDLKGLSRPVPLHQIDGMR